MDSNAPQWLLDLQASTARFENLAKQVQKNSENFVVELRKQAKKLSEKKEKNLFDSARWSVKFYS